jgi:hypothetical protein
MSAGLLITFFLIITYATLNEFSQKGILFSSWFVGVETLAIFMTPLILLSVAPAKAVSRRLIFLALGLILLIALNELSKLGLDVTAPKLQG